MVIRCVPIRVLTNRYPTPIPECPNPCFIAFPLPPAPATCFYSRPSGAPPFETHNYPGAKRGFLQTAVSKATRRTLFPFPGVWPPGHFRYSTNVCGQLPGCSRGGVNPSSVRVADHSAKVRPSASARVGQSFNRHGPERVRGSGNSGVCANCEGASSSLFDGWELHFQVLRDAEKQITVILGVKGFFCRLGIIWTGPEHRRNKPELGDKPPSEIHLVV